MGLDIKDIVLAIILGMMGFIFTTNMFTKFLNSLNPIVGLAIYYLFFFVMVIILSKMDLIILAFQVKNWSRVVGMFLITMAFVIILSWGNYSIFSTNAMLPPDQQTAGNVIYQSMDGVLWWGYSSLFVPNTPFKLGLVRILVYVLSPFLLVLSGGLLMGKKQPEMSPIG